MPRLRASSATPFFPFKIIWSLVSVVTLGTFSFGGPVTGWLLPSLGGDGVKDCGRGTRGHQAEKTSLLTAVANLICSILYKLFGMVFKT